MSRKLKLIVSGVSLVALGWCTAEIKEAMNSGRTQERMEDVIEHTNHEDARSQTCAMYLAQWNRTNRALEALKDCGQISNKRKEGYMAIQKKKFSKFTRLCGRESK